MAALQTSIDEPRDQMREPQRDIVMDLGDFYDNCVTSQIAALSELDNAVGVQPERRESDNQDPESNMASGVELVGSELLADLGALQRKDKQLLAMIEYLELGILPPDDKAARRIVLQADYYILKEGILHHVAVNKNRRTKTLKPITEQKVVPECLQPEILRLYHDVTLCHGGTDRTYAAISSSWHWSCLYNSVRLHVRNCIPCSQSKSYALNRTPLMPYQIESLGSRLHCDVVGPLTETTDGSRFIFSVIESMSNYVFLFATPDQRSETLAQKLLTVCAMLGPFKSLVSDCGSPFNSSLMTSFCKLFGVNKVFISPGHQSANGKCERVHKTLGETLRAVTGGKDDQWHLKLPLIELAYRSSDISGIGLSPHEIVFGSKPRTIADVLVSQPQEGGEVGDLHEYVRDLKDRLKTIHDVTMSHIAENQSKMKAAYDAKVVRSRDYKVGETVWLHDPSSKPNECHKLRLKWVGPFIVTDVLEYNNYRLKHIQTGKVVQNFVNSDRLKAAYIPGYPPHSSQSMEDVTGADMASTESPRVTVEVTPLSADTDAAADARATPDASHGCSAERTSPPGENRINRTAAVVNGANQRNDDSGTSALIRDNPAAGDGNISPTGQPGDGTVHKSADAQTDRKARVSTVNKTNNRTGSGTYFAAEKLLKQKRLLGEMWYLVKWAKGPKGERFPDSWSKAADVTPELVTQFYITHSKNGVLRAQYRRRKPKRTL